MKKILLDIRYFSRISWRLESNDNWLVREDPNRENVYFFDITNISKPIFKAIRTFEVVNYEKKTIIKLSYFQKFKIIYKLKKVLGSIRCLSRINSAKKAIDNTRITDLLRCSDYSEGRATSKIGNNNYFSGYTEFDLGLTSDECGVSHRDKITAIKAKNLLDNSISKEEILNRKTQEEEFTAKMLAEKEKIKEIINKVRKKYE